MADLVSGPQCWGISIVQDSFLRNELTIIMEKKIRQAMAIAFIYNGRMGIPKQADDVPLKKMTQEKMELFPK